jgi:hypothetical protein
MLNFVPPYFTPKYPEATDVTLTVQINSAVKSAKVRFL